MKKMLVQGQRYFHQIISVIDRFAFWIALVWVLLLSGFYSALALIRHNNFQSGAFDLGIFDQAIWQYAHLLYPYNTIKERFILGDHLTLTLPLFAPLFYIWDDVRILLITQAIWISFSALAIYKITRLRKFSPSIALIVCFVYSIFYGIQFATYFDWHPVIFGVGLLAWLAYFFEAGKKRLFWITLVMMLLTQENMGIALASLGCIYLFYKNYRKQALFFIIGGIVIGLISVGIISKLSPVGYQYAPHISSNPIVVLSQYADTHDKQLVWFYSFAGFAFLPLLSIGSVFAVILDLTQYFAASSEFGHMLTPYLHHRAVLAVFLALGTLDAFRMLEKHRVKIMPVAVCLLVITVVLQYIFHFPLNKLVKQEYWASDSWTADNRELIKQIPPDASLAATQNLVPHVAHRKEIYLIWPRLQTGDGAQKRCHQDTCWWLDFAGKPQYLFVNRDNRQWITGLLESPEHFNQAVQIMEKMGKIKVVKQVNTAYLYKVVY